MKNFLMALLIVALIPLGAQADEVSLLIWVEDSVSDRPKALPREKFDAAINTWRTMGVGQIRSVFIETGRAGELADRVSSILHPDDKVVNLIIATHGSVNPREHIVELEDVGEFGVEGVTGGLRSIFEILGSSLSANLHISLQACSTNCGTPHEIAMRIAGLKIFLARFGVRTLSVWGARHLLAHDISYQPVARERHMAGVRSGISATLQKSAAATLFFGVAAFAIISNLNFDLDSLRKAAWIAGHLALGSGFVAYMLNRWSVVDIDKRGYLVSMDGEGIRGMQFFDIDAGTVESIVGRRTQCKMLFRTVDDQPQ